MNPYYKPIQFVRASASNDSSQQPLPDSSPSTTTTTTTTPTTDGTLRPLVIAEDVVGIYTSIIGTSRHPGPEEVNPSTTQRVENSDVQEYQVQDAEITSGEATLAEVKPAEKRKWDAIEHDNERKEEEEDYKQDIFSQKGTPLAQRSWKHASNPASLNAEETVRCQDCNLDIPEQDHSTHIRGTAHLLSKKEEVIGLTPLRRPLWLDETNIGYQLAIKSGWTRDKGLGIGEQGIREPIATRLKLDRLGLGNKEAGPKAITHTNDDIKKASSAAPGKAKRRKADTPGESPARLLTGKEVRQQHERDRKKTQAIMEYLKK